MRFSILCLLCVTAYAAVAICATDGTDFSGTYTLAPGKESVKSQKQTVKTLTVVQTDSSIEVREVEAGRTNINRYPLGEQQGSYVSPGGLEGTCKGKLGKKSLFLESFVTARPDPKGPPVQIHTKQKWDLSTDMKTLRIHVAVDSPQSPINVVEPWTDIYTRN